MCLGVNQRPLLFRTMSSEIPWRNACLHQVTAMLEVVLTVSRNSYRRLA
jgi:hypothetical protein